jgi:electron transport complex protein RnfC
MLKTFPKGGLHVPDFKLSEKETIINLDLPKTVSIPIAQHIGAPAKVIVDRKDKVKTGQIIATSAGFISANIHSPVTGVVTKVDNVLDASGYKRTAVMVRVEPDVWADGIDTDPALKTEIIFSREEIIEKIKAAGIVGLGGATFPSHVKLMVPEHAKNPELLLINGVECEPYLTADHRLMLEKPDEIIVGVNILKKGLNVKKVAIGIENNKKDAIKVLKKAASAFSDIEIVPLKVKYPQGGEKQLIKAVTRKEVPNGKLPIDVGAVVYNVGTVFAVYEAIQKNKPLIERVVTVTGKSLVKPSNFWVRIGTPIQYLLDAVGGVPEDTGKIINGGPMMGKALKDAAVPVTKGTSGILLIPGDQSKRRETQACIRCSKCVEVCPMGLEPYLLMTLAEKVLYERSKDEDVLNCIECGSCSYICPSSRPLLDYIRLGKSGVNKLMKSQKNVK